ncbi:carbohydrate ABC transporter permease [Phyllobacterium chamaecytisi]|uniref:carbohydrate ABC transporter permease n=1 Tax=Phyllobacterium chamaecytisi TaxID=2876082 RepID=UPI001CCFC8B1|nr:sugar ABC transporter permease [Phyllobacterium sp. KW56]MBZ9603142.1 sugar ABC transporter permease [Phyllobacterium sp. KW56]
MKTAMPPQNYARVKTAWLFIAPMLIVLAAVAAWPLLNTAYYSLTNARLSDLSDPSFIGLRNYLNYNGYRWSGLLTSPIWWKAVLNTLWFMAVSVSLEVVIGFGVALVLHHQFPGRGLARVISLIPWAIPAVVSAQIWSWMLHEQFGIINDFLMVIGAIETPIAWAAKPSTAMWAIVFADVWGTFPFIALLMLAALQTLPADLYEAAKIDGISPIKVFFKITLPLTMPALVVAVIFRSLDALRIFDLVYVMSGRNPQTMTISVFIRQRLVDFQDIGTGSAASMLLFIIGALVVIIALLTRTLRLSEVNES